MGVVRLTICALRDGGFSVAEPNGYDASDLDVFAAATLEQVLAYVAKRMAPDDGLSGRAMSSIPEEYDRRQRHRAETGWNT